MARVIHINVFDGESIERAIKETQRFQEKLTDVCKEIVAELTDLGLFIASAEFARAEYAGWNDTTVSTEISPDGMHAKITANGWAVLFIEFGTGIIYPENHTAREHLIVDDIYERGTYGLKKGSNPNGWEYNGVTGQNPPDGTFYIIEGQKVHTMGNVANASMWLTRQELIKLLNDVAQRAMEKVYD